MSYAVKTDYVDEALGLLRYAYLERPRLAALLSALVAPAQVVEDALADLSEGLLLQNATGQTLDGIGSLVGIDRNGLADDEYRLLIYGQIASNHGDATTDALVGLAKKLFNTDAVFCKTSESLRRTGGPTGAFVQLAIGSPKLPERLWPIASRLIRQNVAGGISLEKIYYFNIENSFGFSQQGQTPRFYVHPWSSSDLSLTQSVWA